MVSLMIVDDSDEVRRLLRTVVADVAAPIYECCDGGAACATYARHRPDWVFMDVSMAPMDGITATRQIVQAFPSARIVIVTQYDDVRLRRAAREAGACGYVLKDNLFEVRQFFDHRARIGR
jgi:CheY-like chemotaxis protein